MTRQWSAQQQAVFDRIAEARGHSAVRARAGTGKTSVIVESIKRLLNAHPQRRVLVLAFNVRNRQELEAKLSGTNAIAWTYNQLGFRFCTSAWPRIKYAKDKSWDVARDAAASLHLMSKRNKTRPDREWVRRIKTLAAMCKHTLPASTDDMVALAIELNLTDDTHNANVLVEGASRALTKCLSDTSTADFDDQIYMPVRYELTPPFVFDNVFIDEAQDTDRAQTWLAERVLNPKTGCMTIVGDDRQAIYEWRGAGERAMDDLIERFSAPILPLTTTYRCAKRIVEEAQTIVSDIEGRPDAPDGDIIEHDVLYPSSPRAPRYIDPDAWDAWKADCEIAEARAVEIACRHAVPGDAILSRTNKALVSAAQSVMRAGHQVIIVGKDPSAIRGLVEEAEDQSSSVRSAIRWIRKYIETEKAKHLAVEREDLANEAKDLGMTAITIGEMSSSFQDWHSRIDTMFAKPGSDVSEYGNRVVCSTVHRAKGFEWPNVYLIGYTMQTGTVPEDNIRYVAITRAKERLVWIGRPYAVATPTNVPKPIDDKRKMP